MLAKTVPWFDFNGKMRSLQTMLNGDLTLNYGVMIMACCRDKSIIHLTSDSKGEIKSTARWK